MNEDADKTERPQWPIASRMIFHAFGASFGNSRDRSQIDSRADSFAGSVSASEDEIQCARRRECWRMTPAPVGGTTFVRLPAATQTSDGLELGRAGLGVAGVGDDQPVSQARRGRNQTAPPSLHRLE